MPAGLNVINTAGSIQITESFRNLQFLGADNISISGTWSTWVHTNNIMYQTTNDVAFVAFRCTNGKFVEKVSCRKSDATHNYIYATAEIGATITVYKFGFPAVKAGSYFEVYNASGQLVFSDNNKFMKVISDYRGTLALSLFTALAPESGSTAVQNISLPHANAAIMLSTNAYYAYREGGDSGQSIKEYPLTYAFSGATVSMVINYSQWNDFNGLGSGQIFSGAYYFLILDVTGL